VERVYTAKTAPLTANRYFRLFENQKNAHGYDTGPTDEISSLMIRNPLHPWDQYLIRGNYFFSSPHISTPCSSGR
jgi:hypothetical protein